MARAAPAGTRGGTCGDEPRTRWAVARAQCQCAIYASLPGAGKRLAPWLLAGWGDDRERSASAASGQALAGSSPVAYESGKYTKAHRRYACVKGLRTTLCQLAWQSAWAETY